MVFDEQGIKQLAKSIEQHGIIQPITLRRVRASKYQIISGERRFRAAQMAGLSRCLPTSEADDLSVLEMALVENIQRRPQSIGSGALLSATDVFERMDERNSASASAKGGPPSPTTSACSTFPMPSSIDSANALSWAMPKPWLA